MNLTERLEMVRNGSHVPTPALLDEILQMPFTQASPKLVGLMHAIQMPHGKECLEFIERLEDDLRQLGDIDTLEDAVDRLRPAAYYAWANRDDMVLAQYALAVRYVRRYNETAAALRHYKRKFAALCQPAAVQAAA